MVERIDLSEQKWTFKQEGTENNYKAQVPGNIISDLITNGKVPDPYYRFNEDSVQWVEKENWEYETTFELSRQQIEKAGQQLVFHGLDTYSEVYLNDSLILNNENMFVGHKVDVKGILKQGENSLYIRFISPLTIEKQRYEALGYLPRNLNEKAPDSARTRVFSRKAPFHYGWDWGPRLVTSGIWRPIELVLTETARINNVYYQPIEVSSDSALYKVEVAIESVEENVNGLINVLLNNKVLATKKIDIKNGVNIITLDINVENPRLWWCNGYGEPYLYNATVELKVNGDNDLHKSKLGIRSVELVQEPDSIGRSFYFKLNGVPVFAKGANYIPNHVLTTEVNEDIYNRVLNDAVDANMNMLRVWGGAIYEEDLFYQLCDEKGILIWQDFMFACDLLPPTDYMTELIKAEVEFNVKRLRNYASIVLWCGNNENLNGFLEWWLDLYPDEQFNAMKTMYHNIFDEVIPELVNIYDPARTYWNSSPAAYPGNVFADRKSGDEHDWKIWFGRRPLKSYYDSVPRFVSEYGVQSYPSWEVMQSFSEEEDLFFQSPLMDFRQRSKLDFIKPGYNSNHHMRWYAEQYFHKPADFKSEVYISQLFHSLALKTAIEAHRSNMPHCMGSLYWQLNDCWPTMSWATVDYYGNWKAPHYFVKKAYKPLLVVPFINNQQVSLKIISDNWSGNTKLSVYGFTTEYKQEAELLLTDSMFIKRLDNISVTYDDLLKNYNGLYLRITDSNGDLLAENTWLKKLPKDIQFDTEPQLKIEQRYTNDTIKVKIQAQAYIKGLRLSADKPVEYSDNFFDVVPGIVHEINIIPTEKALESVELSYIFYNNLYQ